MDLTNSEQDVLAPDLFGHYYNKKYPPQTEKYGNQYLGYPNWNQEVFYFEFAVQGYDVEFKYNGKTYYLMADSEYYCTCPDNRFTPDESSIYFKNGNELIEQLEIEGHKLIDIIDDLEDVEMM